MGALSSNRKRGDEYFSPNHLNPYQNSPSLPASKKPRFSFLHPSPDKPVLSSNSTVARISRYPAIKPPLCREVHAPCRILKFRLPSRSNQVPKLDTGGYSERDKSGSSMGNHFSHYDNAKRTAFHMLRYFKKDKEVIEVDNEPRREEISEDSSIEEVDVTENGREVSVEEVQVIEDGREGRSMVFAGFQELGGKMVEEKNLQPSSSSVLTNMNNGTLKVDATGKMLGSMSLSLEVVEVPSVEAYRKLLASVEKRNSRLKELDFEIAVAEKRRACLSELRALRKSVEKPVEVRVIIVSLVFRSFRHYFTVIKI